MTPLITTEELIALAYADTGYLPADLFSTADIAAAEARFLIPVVGWPLWQELLEGVYPELRELIAPAAACAARLHLQPTLAASGSDKLPRAALRARLEALLRPLSDHLDEHAADYPEYDASENVLRRVHIASGVVLPR